VVVNKKSNSVGNRKKILKKLSHVDSKGRVKMVDVGEKASTKRLAVAHGSISMSAKALGLIRSGKVAKGDPLQAARLAGILAAKRTADLVPLCHSVPLTHIDVELLSRKTGYDIEARVSTSGKTGVEMEALVAVSVAALTVYDMIKAVDRKMVIGEIKLIQKSGGSSGDYLEG